MNRQYYVRRFAAGKVYALKRMLYRSETDVPCCTYANNGD